MSFSRIIRSSMLMGGASAVTLATNLARAKVIAIMIGAQGIGLMGILTAFNGNIASLAGWGIGTTGVRALSSASEEQRPSTLAAVRRFGHVLAWIGALLMILFFWPISVLTFKESGHEFDLLCAGLAIPLMVATGMWSAVLQAGGHLRQLAFSQIAAAVGGLLLGVPFIWIYGIDGIAPSIVIAALVPAIVTWRYADKLHPAAMGTPINQDDIRAFIKLGGALTLAGLVGQVAAYGSRMIIIKSHGLESAGYYQAAFSTAGSLPGFVFAAMCADFFPRVAAARTNNEAMSLVEGQIQAGILLTVPALTLLLVMGGKCMSFLFTSSFEQSVPVLSWMVWGVFMRVISFPMGYFLLARGSSRSVLLAETVGGVVLLLLGVFLVPSCGLLGAGYAFFGSAAAHSLFLSMVLRAQSGRWINVLTLSACLSGVLMLSGARLLAELRPDGWWPLVPVFVVGTICFGIYLNILGKESAERKE